MQKRNLTFLLSAVLLSFMSVTVVSALQSQALISAGLGGAADELPEAPVPAAGADAAGQAPDVDLFSYFGRAEKPEASLTEAEAGFKGLADSVFSVDLKTIKNAYLKPAVGFVTGKGTKVYVSGTKAANCPDGGNACEEKEKFFLVLTTDRNESFFVRAMDVVNWGLFMSGSKTVGIDGEAYVIRVKADMTDPETSMIEIRGPRGVALRATLKEVGDAVAARGVDVKLGRNYKLAYGNEILQGPGGARFTDRMLLLFIPFPPVDAATYYIFDVSQIRPAGVTFPSFEKGYGFRLEGTVLDIYRL